MYSLHLDGAPISSYDIVNEKYKTAREFTFQKPVYNTKKRRSSLALKIVKGEGAFGSMLDTVMKQDTLKAELAQANQATKDMNKKFLVSRIFAFLIRELIYE